MGSNCLWTSSPRPCAYCFSCLVPSVPNSFRSFHVVGWNDLWIWYWVCDNHGWNHYWDGPALFDWASFPWTHPCKTNDFNWYKLDNLVFILDLTFLSSASPFLRIISCWMCSNGWRDGLRKLLWLDLLGRGAGSINLKWLPSLGFHHFRTQFSTMQ